MSDQPKNQGSNNSTTTTTNQGVFNDFESPNTTDGSYRGTMANVKATELHYTQKVEEKLKQANDDLKRERRRVSIKQIGNKLYLRATLPLKPDDSNKGKDTKQYDVALKVNANLEGIKTAIEQAYKMSSELDRNIFDWGNWIETSEKAEVKTIGELLDQLEEKYFETRKRTIKSEHSFYSMYRNLIGIFRNETESSFYEIEKKYNLMENSSGKDTLGKNINTLFKCFDISIRVNRPQKRDIKRKPRNIPCDREIVDAQKKFEIHAQNRKKISIPNEKDNWKLWRWVFGMVATYGLRPREIFVNPHIDWWLSSKNIDNTWKVHKDSKTGEREVFPLRQEWVELFDLKNKDYLNMLQQRCINDDFKLMNRLVLANAEWFRLLELGFQPYDLRHAWAIRAHMMGIPIKAAADNLGHSVEEHTRTYQQWFGRENRRIAINQAIAKKSEVEFLKEKVSELTLEIERLKLENQKLKLESKFISK
jgi:integrase